MIEGRRVFVSVVIPTFHRNERLSAVLDLLAPGRQDDMTLMSDEEGDRAVTDTPTYEVIVSDAGIRITALDMIRTQYSWVRWVPCPGAGPAANRNNGSRVAHGEWLAFIDDDCLPAPEWLSALYRAAHDSAPDVIEGSMVAPDGRDSVFRHPVENLTGDLYWSGNLAVRREVFNRLGCFDEDFLEACCEDVEFADRIRRSGVHTTFCPAAAVVHPCHIVTLRYLFARALRSRWHLLYLHKTGRAVSLQAPAWRALAHLVVFRARGLVSMTRRLRRLYPGRPRTALVDVTVDWLTFPFVLAYLMYWELRFRKLLLNDRNGPNRT